MPSSNAAPVSVLRRGRVALAFLFIVIVLVLEHGPGAPPIPLPPPSSGAGPADWPMSRHDVRRSGGTSHQLPLDLNLHSVRHLPPLSPAWPDQPKMPFDAAYDPIVVSDSCFVASALADTITAYDVTNGS